MARLVNPAGIKRQIYYNHAVVKPGFPVFFTGQVGCGEDGKIIGNDIAAQAAQIWHNIGLLLQEIGAVPGDIVKLVTYATSRDHLPALHAARAVFFGDGPFPASTFILVAGLAEPEMLAEIDVVVMIER